ncbi:MAG: TrmB family transcriptional regulator [Candidatus Kerfeldbacteria bacterium]|jgi:HTH-type transcriptional regulator, sugar sensing transcriptional regulator
MINTKQLEEFGLTDKEASVYIASLKLGYDSVQNIAKTANIHRVTTYDILRNLISQGLISQSIKGKKKQFIAEKPEKILASLKQKQEKFSSLLPELKAIQNKGKGRPQVMYYEGKEAVWKAYQDRVEHDDYKENLVYGSSEKLFETFPEGYKKITRMRMLRGIQVKLIVERSEHGEYESKTSKHEYKQVKFLPKDKKFFVNTIIYGNRVMIVSWQTMMSVIIVDQANADNQRFVFNLLWDFL